MKSLQDKIILVLGGASGIGFAIAEAAAREGAHVLVASRRADKVSEAMEQLSSLGNPLQSLGTVDCSKPESLDAFHTRFFEHFGRLDGFVYTAGCHLKKPAEDVSWQEWQDVIALNLNGAFLSNRLFGQNMLQQGSGSIVNIGSLGSKVALSGASAYCASKAGVEMLSKCLSTEWAARGVRVNCLLPGVFPTDLNRKALSDPQRVQNILKRTPMERMGDVQELAGAALYLLSDESQFVSGASLAVDGGFLAASGF